MEVFVHGRENGGVLVLAVEMVEGVRGGSICRYQIQSKPFCSVVLKSSSLSYKLYCDVKTEKLMLYYII